MRVYNPGNVLPFYNDQRWQRHRQIGQDTVAYGLPAPNTRLLPWQLFIENGTANVFTTSWSLVNAVDESETIPQPSTILELSNRDGGGFWITWKAEEVQGFEAPPCGFWFIRVYLPGVVYTSEVMHTMAVAAYEATTLQLLGCSTEDSIFMDLAFEGVDTLADTPVVSETIEKYDGADWVQVGTSDAVVPQNGTSPGSFQIRRTIITQAGNTLIATYEVSWEDVCEGISMILTGSQSTFEGTAETWRLRMTNPTDKGTVLYQTGYEQHSNGTRKSR
jgi:hypothetical protein